MGLILGSLVRMNRVSGISRSWAWWAHLLWRGPVAVLSLVMLGVLLVVVCAWRTSGRARRPRGASAFFQIG